MVMEFFDIYIDVLVGKHEERRHLEDINLFMSIILKLILNK